MDAETLRAVADFVEGWDEFVYFRPDPTTPAYYVDGYASKLKLAALIRGWIDTQTQQE